MVIIKYGLLFVYMIILVKLILKKQPIYLAYWFLPLFMFAWKMVSLIYLEQGSYATELYRTTYSIGTDYIFILLMTIFFLVGIKAISIFQNSFKIEEGKISISPGSKQFILWTTNCHIIVLGYLYTNLILTGGAFSSSSLTFIQNSKLPFVGSIGSTLVYFLLIVDGVSAFCLKQNRKKAVILYILSVLYMLMIGAKFSGLYQYTVFFFAPLYINFAISRKIRLRDLINKKILIPVIIVFVALISYSFWRYQNSGLSINAIDTLTARVFDMQSGTMWGINEYLVSNKIALFGDTSQLSIELSGLRNGLGELDGTIGLGKVMYLVAPSSVAKAYLSSGLRFSGWFLVVSFLSLGYIGSALLCVLTAVIFGLICVSVNLAIQRGHVLWLALSIYEYCQFFDYYRIGNFSILFNLQNILIMVCIAGYLMLLGRKKVKLRWR